MRVPKYGRLLAAFPTAPGDVWRVGPHAILCADAREAEAFGWIRELLKPYDRADDAYVVPPRHRGDAAQALRKAGRGVVSVNYEDLLFRLLRLCETTAPQGVWWFGLAKGAQVTMERLIAERGLSLKERHDEGLMIDSGSVAQERHDELVYFAPCCGDLMDLRGEVQKEVAVIRGIEVVPGKCAVALENLSKWTGAEPVRDR